MCVVIFLNIHATAMAIILFLSCSFGFLIRGVRHRFIPCFQSSIPVFIRSVSLGFFLAESFILGSRSSKFSLAYSKFLTLKVDEELFHYFLTTFNTLFYNILGHQSLNTGLYLVSILLSFSPTPLNTYR